jgi:hypothetical protein
VHEQLGRIPHGKEVAHLVGSDGSRQARRAFTARALKRDQRKAKTSVVPETKALGGDGVEFPAAPVAVMATLRTMAKLPEDYITALEHLCRQLQVSTRCCKMCPGPTPEASVVAASGLWSFLRVWGRTLFGRIPTIGKWPQRLAVASFPGGRRIGAEDDRPSGWLGGPSQ